ncbi:50S ribosomal protein L7ae [Candidatus Woesearchaeota archaeon]|nr:50S ribosomal protein L7ae [Candidatus Woesearchaeota archaeon]
MSEQTEKAIEAIEVAKNTGKLKKGTNEVTKALERGTAKLVAYAKDVSPPEITMHIPLLAKEKGIPCVEIPTKDELGAAAGIKVGTAAVAITAEGDAKKIIAEITPKEAPAKTEKKEEEKKEKKEEEKKEKKEEEKKEKKEEEKKEKKEEEKKSN